MPVIPRISSAEAAALRSALIRSKRCGEGGVYGNNRSDKPRVTRPIGTSIANNHGQDATARIAEATVGPAAEDIDTATAVIAMLQPNCRRG